MNSYRVILPKSVQKELDKLPKREWEKVVRQIALLKQNPRPQGCVKLKGHKNQYRIRIGSFRVRYEINDNRNEIVVLHCLHRKDIYRI